MIKHNLSISHHFRMAAGVIISAIFSLMGVLLPVFLTQKTYVFIILAWVFIHLVGRVQAVVMLPVWQAIKLQELVTVEPSYMGAFASETEKRRLVAERVWSAHKAVRVLEVWLVQIIPQTLGVFVRVIVFAVLFPEQVSFVILVLGLSSGCFWLFLGKLRRHVITLQYEQLRYEKSLQDYLYQKMFISTESNGLSDAYMRLHKHLVKQELIKTCVGSMLIVFLIGAFVNNIQYHYILPMLLWLGFADQTWALYNSFSEQFTLKDSKSATTAIQPAVYSLDLRDIRLTQQAPGISISLKRGESLHIQGGSGSGKTTLLKILIGQQSPLCGKVYCNDKAQAIHVNENCLILGSQPLLLSGFLYMHVSEASLSALGLESAVEALPEKMKTCLSALHNCWSAGMLQKLNLAFALTSNRDIYLLDEACCHIPLQEEIDFYLALQSQRNKPIIIIVSHQLTAAGINLPKQKTIKLT